MRVSIDVIWLKADGLLVALHGFTCSVETRQPIAFTTIARGVRDSQFYCSVVPDQGLFVFAQFHECIGFHLVEPGLRWLSLNEPINFLKLCLEAFLVMNAFAVRQVH